MFKTQILKMCISLPIWPCSFLSGKNQFHRLFHLIHCVLKVLWYKWTPIIREVERHTDLLLIELMRNKRTCHPVGIR